MSAAACILTATALSKRYPGMDRAAVDDLDIEVRRGEILGLLGANGAGKTTTIAMLAALLRPDSGTVVINGSTSPPRAIIGLVPQENALYPTLTLRENITFFARLYGLNGARLVQRLQQSAAAVALEEMLDQRVDTFSGGMKRRANLALGIVHQPQLLFLDEPTVGIDAQSRRLILDHLLALNRAGTSMVYTTHYMEEAQQLCSRVVIMDAGRAVAAGEVAPLLARHKCTTLEELFITLTGRAPRD